MTPPPAAPRPTTSWSGQRRSFPTRTARYIRARDGECKLRIHPACTRTPDEADHIVGHAEALRLGWTPAQIDHPDNGQAVCRRCHQVKTQQQAAAGRARARAARPTTRRARRHPGLL